MPELNRYFLAVPRHGNRGAEGSVYEPTPQGSVQCSVEINVDQGLELATTASPAAEKHVAAGGGTAIRGLTFIPEWRD